MNRIDHVAIGATDLESGRHWFKDTLGVDIPFGGKHPKMGTHNCLCQAGVGQYLEIIAIDPAAEPPAQPRWFALDSATTQSRLARGPSPLTWVVSTDNVDEMVSSSPIELGEVQTLSRDSLTWKLTVARDGELIENGVVPIFIEWPGGINPSSAMNDIHLQLNSIELRHPNPDYIAQLLIALNIDHLATVTQSATAGIAFCLSTQSHTNVVLE